MSIEMSDIWGELGIEPTTDKKKIKKAYAEAVKHCHPEEHPEEFKKLYEAYQRALERCSSGTAGIPGTDMTFVLEHRQEIRQEKTSHKTAQTQVEIPESNDEGAETAESAKFQELFDKNKRRKQEICDCYVRLWKACLKKKTAQTTADLIDFLRGSEFLMIKDYSDTLAVTEELIVQNTGGISGDIIDLLWEIYDFEQFDVCRGVEQCDPLYQELFKTLGKERDSAVRLETNNKQRRETRKSVVFGVIGIALTLLFLYARTEILIWYYDTQYNNRIAERIRMMGMMEEKYPEFSFIDWSYPPDTQEKTYQLSARAFVKRGNSRKYIKVEIKDNWKGEIVSFQDDFEEDSIKMLAEKYGLSCSGIAADGESERYIVIELASGFEASVLSDGIRSLARTGTVKNLGISGFGVCCESSGEETELSGTVLWNMEELSEWDEDTLAEKIRQVWTGTMPEETGTESETDRYVGWLDTQHRPLKQKAKLFAR